MAKVLVYPSLDSLEAVESTCDQRKLCSDCVDGQADPSSLVEQDLLQVLSCPGSFLLGPLVNIEGSNAVTVCICSMIYIYCREPKSLKLPS